MESNDSALRGTAATPELWGGVYMMLAFALFARGLHGWERFQGRPMGWQDLLALGVELFLCPAPLLVGIAFRKLIKNELKRSQLSARTFKICNFWIAQLLILAYIAIVV